MDALLAVAGAAALRGGFNDVASVERPAIFTTVVAASAALLLGAKVLYQRSLAASPLSITIPYLSFTPVFLLLTAYVLVGESPRAQGVVGVAVVTLFGYLLSLRTASPLKAKLSDPGSAGGISSSGRAIHVHPNCGAAAGGPLTGVSRRAAYAALADRALGPLAVLRKEPGCAYMLVVAAVWSLTASLDKLGCLHSPCLELYFAAQRAAIGLAGFAYAAGCSRGAFGYLRSEFQLLVVISILELASILFFMHAMQHLFTSYVVAIKRCSVLFSVLLGGLVFGERIAGRLPYVGGMMAGMLLIVLQPPDAAGIPPPHR